MTPTTPTLPTVARFVLTKPLPCALFLFIIFSAQLWLPQLFSSVPALALVVAFGCMALNFFTPALVAMVALGGGIVFALQAGLLATVLVFLVPAASVMIAVMFAMMYVLVPAVAARALTTVTGINRAADTLLVVVVIGAIAGLLLVMQMQANTAHEWVNQLISPLFDAMRGKPNGISEQEVQGVQALLGWTLPGMLAISLWLMWGINLAVARRMGMYYGFYEGDLRPVLELRPGVWCGWLLFFALLVANLGSGNLQYMGVTVALLLSSVVAYNGISITHMWLRSRGLLPMIVLMYGLLMFLSMVIFPFIILGLIDLWTDYRSKFKHSNE